MSAWDNRRSGDLGFDYQMEPQQFEMPGMNQESDLMTKMAGLSNPISAGIMVGGSFLQQYMAQRAADERAKRQMEMQAKAQHGASEQNQYGMLMDAYKSALLR